MFTGCARTVQRPAAAAVCCLRQAARGLAFKHVSHRWQRPHSLVDDFNLRRREPDVHDEWSSERLAKLAEIDERAEFGEITPDVAAAESAAVMSDISGLPVRLRRRVDPSTAGLKFGDFPPPGNPTEARSRDYQRACIGRFGSARTGLDPSVCWPETAELAEAARRDRWLEGGASLAELMKLREAARADRARELAELDSRIDKGLKQMPQEMERHRARLAKAAAAAAAAQAEKRAKLEEARDFFGFTVDPKDEKFQRLQEAKSEEAKKAKKAEKAEKAEKRATEAAAQKKKAKQGKDGAKPKQDAEAEDD